MKAFITTRLIDHYEQMVWAQDPQTYALRKLTPDLIMVLEELIHSDKGLRCGGLLIRRQRASSGCHWMRRLQSH